MQSFQKMLPLEFALKEEKVLVKWEGREGPPPSSPKRTGCPWGWGMMGGQGGGNCEEVCLGESRGERKARGVRPRWPVLGSPSNREFQTPTIPLKKPSFRE